MHPKAEVHACKSCVGFWQCVTVPKSQTKYLLLKQKVLHQKRHEKLITKEDIWMIGFTLGNVYTECWSALKNGLKSARESNAKKNAPEN